VNFIEIFKKSILISHLMLIRIIRIQGSIRIIFLGIEWIRYYLRRVLYMCVCVCVCVMRKSSEREREREKWRLIKIHGT
jgi:hypothetical protein